MTTQGIRRQGVFCETAVLARDNASISLRGFSLRIAFVTSSLEAGGAERVASVLANAWIERGVEVVIITFADTNLDFYALDRRIRRVAIGHYVASGSLVRAALANTSRVHKLRQAIKQSDPDIVISFVDKTNITTLFACLGTGIPVIVSERVDVRHYSIGPMWEVLRRIAYRFASALVVQTKDIAGAFSYLRRVRRVVIPNPVPAVEGKCAEPAFVERPFLMGMGRMVPQKGFDLLLAGFARIAARYPEWKLVLVGEGQQRETLQQQARDLGVAERVRFTGIVKEPFSAIGCPDVFVMSSRFEGFPNALCEAMARGVASISFDCPSGPSEIIHHGHDGLLVERENVDELAKAMEKVIGDVALRKALASRASQAIERFSVGRIADEWLGLCGTLTQARVAASAAVVH